MYTPLLAHSRYVVTPVGGVLKIHVRTLRGAEEREAKTCH